MGGWAARNAWMVSGIESNSDLSRAVALMLKFGDGVLAEQRDYGVYDAVARSFARSECVAKVLSLFNDSSNMRCPWYK